MATSYNGTGIKKIVYNGTNVTKLYYNNVLVFLSEARIILRNKYYTNDNTTFYISGNKYIDVSDYPTNFKYIYNNSSSFSTSGDVYSRISAPSFEVDEQGTILTGGLLHFENGDQTINLIPGNSRFITTSSYYPWDYTYFSSSVQLSDSMMSKTIYVVDTYSSTEETIAYSNSNSMYVTKASVQSKNGYYLKPLTVGVFSDIFNSMATGQTITRYVYSRLGSSYGLRIEVTITKNQSAGGGD